MVFHGAPGITVTANDISFSGHTAAIEYRNGRPVKAFVHGGRHLRLNGREIVISDTPTQEIGL